MGARSDISPLIDNIEVCRLLGVKPNTWRMRVLAGNAPCPTRGWGTGRTTAAPTSGRT